MLTAPARCSVADSDHAAFTEKWEKRYPAIIKLWENAWSELVPFLRFDTETRTVVCTTDESVNGVAARAVLGGVGPARSRC
jgi:putative transposase